ncbi:MAG TPA: hypothetical protein VEP50_07965 [bacterium]|nr:hypothetical protein [bacterium]
MSEPMQLEDGWPVAHPEAQGFDAARLAALGPRFDAWSDANLHAVLVTRHGSLVYERYFTGEDRRFAVGSVGRVTYDATMLHELRSAV